MCRGEDHADDVVAQALDPTEIKVLETSARGRAVALGQLAAKVLAVLSQVRKLGHVGQARVNQTLGLASQVPVLEKNQSQLQKLVRAKRSHVASSHVRGDPVPGAGANPTNQTLAARPTHGARSSGRLGQAVPSAVTVGAHSGQTAHAATLGYATAMHLALLYP